ncbi:hypothetical protein GEV33_001967 [Tenebrio molitor]|uniref:Uncharacterized protein n=1 Tax=Tenebrio molitor TaxID=7067 RepID=A0A8J6HL94_TENMO|nr:hypothetical protein GEV33_001967 [Tenebrio molitor]
MNNPLHRVWGLESNRRVKGRVSWRKVLRVPLPQLVYHAVRILGKSSGSFLPSTLPRNNESKSDRVASGLGFLGQGLPGVRSCSLVGSWGMTPAQQGGENDPLTRRVVDPRIHVRVRYAHVSESEDQDEQIPEINGFLFWQTPDDLDDDDDDPEEQEENFQEEFPNS